MSFLGGSETEVYFGWALPIWWRYGYCQRLTGLVFVGEGPRHRRAATSAFKCCQMDLYPSPTTAARVLVGRAFRNLGTRDESVQCASLH